MKPTLKVQTTFMQKRNSTTEDFSLVGQVGVVYACMNFDFFFLLKMCTIANAQEKLQVGLKVI